MNIPIKTLDSGFSLPELGLGTWRMGGAREADYTNDKGVIKSIKSAIDLGYTHIDTAELYGNGHCEELIAKAIKDYDRSKLTIASKVFGTNLKYDDVLKSAEASLKRLEVDVMDLYYIHMFSPETPLKETMKAFNKLVTDGLVKEVAVSNFTVEQLKEAQSYSDNKIVANQIEYSLLTRNVSKYGGGNMEKEMVPYCQESDIMIVTERPVERGAVLEPNLLMEELSKKYDKTYGQLAINWLVSQKNVVTIPKAESLKYQKENLEAVGWYMEDEDVERLKSGMEVDNLF